MNTAIYGSLPASACTLGTQGSHGPDRISKDLQAADKTEPVPSAHATLDYGDTITMTVHQIRRALSSAARQVMRVGYDWQS